MSNELNSRHFATISPSGEEVILLGHRATSNEVLVAFPSAMPASESQALRQIALSEAAQKQDYLLGTTGKTILEITHHPSGVAWQTYLIRQGVTGRSSQVRKLTMKEINFYDPSQKALFSGYGESIEPKSVNPDPVPLTPAPAPTDTAMVDGLSALAPTDTAMVDALSTLAATQQAILEKLTAMDAPAKKSATKRAPRKRGPKKKPAVATEVPAEPAVVVVDEHRTE